MTELVYTDSDGAERKIEGLNLTRGKCGRYWLWCNQTNTNIAYKEKTEKDCYLSAIDSLLFMLQLKDERLAEYQGIVNKAMDFADSIKPYNNDE